MSIIETRIELAFQSAVDRHGQLGLNPMFFSERLLEVARQHVGRQATESDVAEIIPRLFSVDLYLSMACAHRSAAAWELFISHYRKYMRDVARVFASTSSSAQELADSMPGSPVPP